jgi:hypothetical protein
MRNTKLTMSDTELTMSDTASITSNTEPILSDTKVTLSARSRVKAGMMAHCGRTVRVICGG